MPLLHITKGKVISVSYTRNRKNFANTPARAKDDGDRTSENYQPCFRITISWFSYPESCLLHPKTRLQENKGRVLDKREYLMIIRDFFFLILHKICCDPSSEPS